MLSLKAATERRLADRVVVALFSVNAFALTSCAARGRRDHSRQGEPERMGQLPLRSFHQRMERHQPDTSRISAAEEIVLLTEFKADLNAYLQTAPPSVQTRNLTQLIEFNRNNPRERSRLVGTLAARRCIRVREESERAYRTDFQTVSRGERGGFGSTLSWQPPKTASERRFSASLKATP